MTVAIHGGSSFVDIGGLGFSPLASEPFRIQSGFKKEIDLTERKPAKILPCGLGKPESQEYIILDSGSKVW